MDDQFGFRPTGSTTCALTNLIQHVIISMPEKCKFVRCLMIDFSRALDTVDHIKIESPQNQSINFFQSIYLLKTK